MRRRPRIAAALAGALVVVAWIVPGGAQAPALARVKVALIEGTQLFPMWVMQTKGIAEKH